MPFVVLVCLFFFSCCKSQQVLWPTASDVTKLMCGNSAGWEGGLGNAEYSEYSYSLSGFVQNILFATYCIRFRPSTGTPSLTAAGRLANLPRCARKPECMSVGMALGTRIFFPESKLNLRFRESEWPTSIPDSTRWKQHSLIFLSFY